jgi:hypothetical protein
MPLVLDLLQLSYGIWSQNFCGQLTQLKEEILESESMLDHA